MPTPEQDRWLHETLKIEVPPRAPAASKQVANGAADGGGGDGKSGSGIGKLFKNLIKPQTPVPRADLGPTQQDRADKLLADMSKDDRAKVKKILDDAKGDEKKYITKALASKHSAADLVDFAKKIAGKNKKWLDANLHLVGESSGAGIKQQWHDSCGPTTVQAMMGELDPIYALKLHDENTDVTKVDDDDPEKKNKKMADEQKAMLEGHGGVAKSRSDDTGQGMVLGGLLGEQTAKIGIKFDCESAGTDDAMTKALADAETALKGGLPVPVRVGGASGGHFVLMTGVDDGPPRRYSFHDPWDGKTLVFTDTQIKTKNINIAGWTEMTHIYKPSAAAGP